MLVSVYFIQAASFSLPYTVDRPCHACTHFGFCDQERERAAKLCCGYKDKKVQLRQEEIDVELSEDS